MLRIIRSYTSIQQSPHIYCHVYACISLNKSGHSRSPQPYPPSGIQWPISLPSERWTSSCNLLSPRSPLEIVPMAIDSFYRFRLLPRNANTAKIPLDETINSLIESKEKKKIDSTLTASHLNATLLSFPLLPSPFLSFHFISFPLLSTFCSLFSLRKLHCLSRLTFSLHL